MILSKQHLSIDVPAYLLTIFHEENKLLVQHYRHRSCITVGSAACSRTCRNVVRCSMQQSIADSVSLTTQ